MIRSVAVATLLFGCQPALAATVSDLPPAPVPGEVAEGLRFLGHVDDYRVVRVPAPDGEPMYAAIRRGQDRVTAFFRAGRLQCWDGKYEGVPVPCDKVRETALPPVKLAPTVGVPGLGLPGLVVPPTGGIPPFAVGKPGKPGHPGHPELPVLTPETPIPPIAPVPLPSPGALLAGLLAFGWLGRKLLRFSDEYASLREQCCNDPDYARRASA